MMEILAEIVPCWSATLNAVTLSPNRLRSWTSRQAGAQDAIHPALRQHLHEHPTLDRLIQAPESGGARLGTFTTAQELRNNPLIADFYRPMGLRHQLTFAAGQAPEFDDGAVWIIGFNRMDGTDFSAAEWAEVELLRPQVTRALAMLRNRRRQALIHQVREEAKSACGCGTAAFHGDGSLIEASAKARELLVHWKLCDAAGAPSPRLLQHMLQARKRRADGLDWMETDPEGAQLRLHLRWGDRTSIIGLWLRETRPAEAAHLMTALGLTERQAAVAYWVAASKTNGDIALLLGLSPRTIEKHVEIILSRLGLEHRQALAQAVHDLTH